MLKQLEAISIKGVYRGQHGQPGTSIIQTRLPSITFSNLEAAIEYATVPNNPSDRVYKAQVVKADLRIEKPLPLSEDDPFIDAPVILQIMGHDAGADFLIKKDLHIYNTDNWIERFADSFGDVATMVTQSPDLLDELYLDAFVALDDPGFVAAAMALGFDGAVHCGNGLTAAEREYRVFSDSQISNLEVMDLNYC